MELALWLLLAFVSGAALNATPCVLPAVPIKLRLLLQEGGQSAGRRALTGAALLAGSLLFFGGLGALSVALQWTWGAPMGSPVFRGVLAGLLALAAAALIFDLGRMPIPQRIANWRAHGPLEGFAMGVSGGVLSLPCTGPFLGGVLAFSLTQPTTLVVTLFTAVGFGMASPYLVLLAFPRLIPARGINGEVGVLVTRVLGFGLLGGALFYGAEFLPGRLAEIGVGWLLIGALVVWVAASWRSAAVRGERGVAATAAVAVLALTLAAPLAGGPQRLDWQVIERAEASPEAISGPALVEFTADWCLNCKVLERTVYQEPSVARAAADGIATYRVDLTDFDAEAQALLKSWGGTGLPYAVVVGADGEVKHRLRDMFTAETLTTALQDVRDSPARSSATGLSPRMRLADG